MLGLLVWGLPVVGTEGGYYGQFEERANNGSGGTGALIYFLGGGQLTSSQRSHKKERKKMVIHSLGKGWMAKLQTWVASCEMSHINVVDIYQIISSDMPDL